MNKIKQCIVLFFALLYSSFGIANMSQYHNEGRLIAEPFIREFVSITNEKLTIQINQDFSNAHYLVEYTIKSSKGGEQIPMLFYAPEYESDFTILVDGVLVPIETVSNFGSNDVNYFKKFFTENGKYFNLPTSKATGRRTTISDYIYFKLDLSEGEHQIEVTYNSNPWIDTENGYVKNYHFRYALAPAKEWKTFSHLTVELDERDFGKVLETNLGEPTTNRLTSNKFWEFNELPQDMIEITYKPRISLLAQFFLLFKSMGFALLVTLLLGILHYKIIPAPSEQSNKRTPILLIGSLIVSAITIAIYLYLDNEAYRYFIGEHAFDRGYASIFLAIVGFPALFGIYYCAMWLLTRFKKVKK